MTTYDFVGDANFRGKTPANWMEEWVQWMHGADVSYRGNHGDVLYIRGGLSYEYKDGRRRQVDPAHKETVFITDQIPIYINLRTAFYFVGERHPFGSMQTPDEVLGACRDDHARGQIVSAEIIDPDGKKVDLKKAKTYVEAFNFSVHVHPNSLLADQFEFEVQRGAELTGCAVGDICFIRNLNGLSAGKYQIKTSNVGARDYSSNSDYTINLGPQTILNPRSFI